jgi:hypothetical protein
MDKKIEQQGMDSVNPVRLFLDTDIAKDAPCFGLSRYIFVTEKKAKKKIGGKF